MRQCSRWKKIPEGGFLMAESGGLPSWVEAWVGKVVQVHVHGDSDPLFGVLEDWDRRGVVLRHTEDMVRLTASRVEDVPSEPMMILVTWSSVRYVSVLMEELEKDHPRD
jgi:hypothetical protein